MKYLVIIGNGFDLAHGLKTNYKSFLKNLVDKQLEDLKHIFDSNYEKKLNNPLFDLSANFINEHKYSQIIPDLSYDRFINDFKVDHSEENWVFKNLLFKKFLREDSENWCDLEVSYYKELLKLNNEKNYNNQYSSIAKLNSDFDVIKNHLSMYLERENNSSRIDAIEGYNQFFRNLPLRGTCFLTFNYTRTLELYLDDVIYERNVVHIHGDLDSEIIFGYAASDNEIQKIQESEDREYTKNIKPFEYNLYQQKRKLYDFLKGNEPINIIIMGHSCGMSDQNILNVIFSNSNVKEIWLWYYKNREYYLDLQYNISKVSSNINDALDLIIPIQKSPKMPQLISDKKEQNEFMRLIIGYSKEILNLSKPGNPISK